MWKGSKGQSLSAVLLGPVPSICNLLILFDVSDYRHETDDDVAVIVIG
jgi:hypothetical protein